MAYDDPQPDSINETNLVLDIPKRGRGRPKGKGKGAEPDNATLLLSLAELLPKQVETIKTTREEYDTIVPSAYEVWPCGVYLRDLTQGRFTPGDAWPTPSLKTPLPEQHKLRLQLICATPMLFTRAGTQLSTYAHETIDDILIGLELHTAGKLTRQAWASVETISDSRRILALARWGADVTSVNAGAVVAYLAAARAANRHRQPVRVVRRCGYYEIDGRPCWLVGDTWLGHNRNITVDLSKRSSIQRAYGPRPAAPMHWAPLDTPEPTEADVDAAEEEETELLHAQEDAPGDDLEEQGFAEIDDDSVGRVVAPSEYEEWRSDTWALLSHERGALLRWVFGFTCVAPISDLIGQYGFLAHLYAQAGRGKSAIMRIALTVWGNSAPGGLMQMLDKTRLAIVQKFVQHASHLIMGFDEVQVAGGLAFDTLIYSLSGGQARGRVDVSGRDTESDEQSFKAIALTTGEHTIVGNSKRDTGGQAKRVIEIDINRHVALPPEVLRGIYRTLDKNQYGWGGLVFLSAIHKRFCQTAQGVEELKAKHKEMETQVRNALEAEDPTIVQRLASVAFAEALLLALVYGDKLCPEGDDRARFKAAWAMALGDAVHVYNTAIASSRVDDARPLHERALTAIRNDVSANPELYPRVDDAVDAAVAVRRQGAKAFNGMILRTDKGTYELVVFDGPFRRMCHTELACPERRVLADLADAGVCLTAGKSHKVERARKHVLLKDRYIVIPMVHLSAEEDEAGPAPIDFGARAEEGADAGVPVAAATAPTVEPRVIN